MPLYIPRVDPPEMASDKCIILVTEYKSRDKQSSFYDFIHYVGNLDIYVDLFKHNLVLPLLKDTVCKESCVRCLGK